MALTREEHLAWCKQRAREYAERGENQNAYSSLISDLNKHEQTQGSVEAIGVLGMMQLLAGTLDTREQMLAFIDGVN